MSDDRMDRAERIRNMREGNRSTDDDQTGADDASSPGTDTDESTGTTTEPGAGESQTTTPEPSAEESGKTPEPSAGETPSETDGDASGFTPLTTDEESADAASAGGLGPDATTEAGADATDAASEAQAAAQRAAASAAEVMGADSDAGATPGAGDQTAAGTETSTEPEADAPAAPAGGAVPGDVNGVELPDRELLEEAMATSSVESTEGGARAAMEGGTTQSEEVVRVLEFSLGDEYYCLDIEYVEEIVKRNAVTRVPNTPDFVDGVVDLRGQITTILEPKEMMTIDGEGEQNLIIVFDPDQFEEQGAIGWVVDEVRQVVPVTESEINTPPVDADYINGVVDREEYDQFVIWIEPEDVLAQATATDEE